MTVNEAIAELKKLDGNADLIIREYGEPMYVAGLRVCSENDCDVEEFQAIGNKVLVITY